MKLKKSVPKTKVINPTDLRKNLFKILDEIALTKESKIIKRFDNEFEITIKKKKTIFDKVKPIKGLILAKSDDELIYHNLGKWNEKKTKI